MFRKGKWGRKARKRPPTKRTRSPAVILQRVGCGRKVKVGIDRKDRPSNAKERLPPNRKGIVPLKRKRTNRSPSSCCQFYSLPFDHKGLKAIR